jgi:hypothetical protein
MQWDDSIASLFPKHPRQFEARSALNDDKRQSSDCCGQSLRTIKHVVSLKVGFRSASSQRALDNTLFSAEAGGRSFTSPSKRTARPSFLMQRIIDKKNRTC